MRALLRNFQGLCALRPNLWKCDPLVVLSGNTLDARPAAELSGGVCTQVDEEMRVLLQNLKDMVDAERAAKTGKKPKKKKKKGKKKGKKDKKGKKRKDPTVRSARGSLQLHGSCKRPTMGAVLPQCCCLQDAPRQAAKSAECALTQALMLPCN